MFKGIWKAVETRAGEISMVKAKKRREKEMRGSKKRKKKKNNRSKEDSRKIGDLE